MADLTETKLESARRKLLRKMVLLYEACPQAPESAFWLKLDAWEERLVQRSRKRPLTSMEIETMFSVLEREFGAILRA